MNVRPDLLLINPGNRREVYQSLADLAAIEPPVWCRQMADFARRKGLGGVEVLDANAFGLAPDEVARRVSELRPPLAAVVVYGHQPSASTQNMFSAGAIVRAIRDDPECAATKTILVGGHVAALPERTLREEAADFTALDEGLHTLVELVTAIRAGGPFDGVPGLVWRDGKAIRKNRPSPLLTNLDEEMPGLAWDLLPMERYRAHNWHTIGFPTRQPYASLYTTLGCPFDCTYCCIQAPFKAGEGAMGMAAERNSYRRWSPQTVAQNLELLAARYGVRHVKIADEMFVLNRQHVQGICDEIIGRGLGDRLNIWAYARIDTVRDDKLLGKMRRAGFSWLCFGIESGSERVRKDVRKGLGSQDDIIATVRRVQGHGFYVLGNFIFGLPEDDETSMQATLDLALELNCEFANFYSAMAYPGSALYDEAIHQGWPLPASWAGYSQHARDTLPLPTKHLSGAEVLRFRDRAFRTYFENPAYLNLVRQKFGQAAVEEIQAMAGRTLERTYA